MENFGVFKGRHVFDLKISDDSKNPRPLVLFGGRNGTGKTTLFEGVRLCIYGASFKGYRLPPVQYEKYLRRRIHHQRTLPEYEGSSVSLQFQHSHLGKTSAFFIKRSWDASTPIKERLEVLQDGKPVEGVTDDQLQDFLMELIPIGLSKLFFFDGEQIQGLAQDEPNNKHLIDAFNSLLGLDIVEHLEADLRIHLSRQGKEAKSASLGDYHALLNEKKALESELHVLLQKMAQKQSDIDYVNSETERVEHSFASEGGGFAGRREHLKARKSALEAQIVELEEGIRSLASSFLPFSLAPSLCLGLRERLLTEERWHQEIAAREVLHRAAVELTSRLCDNSFWDGMPMVEDHRKVVASKVIRVIQSIIGPEDEDHVFLHQLSVPDQRKMLNWIDQSLKLLPDELKIITGKLEEKTGELRSVEEDLVRVPPDEAIAPLIKRLNALHEERGGFAKEMSMIEEKVKHVEFKVKEVERKLRDFQEEQRKLQAATERIELGNKVQEVLKGFSEILRTDKLRAVTEQFVTYFNNLSTKNLIDRIQVDREDFSVTLFRRDGTAIPKEELSAGEKQIYAIAMLLALARVSGRPLPFMIDTPLARLDQEHRTNLVRNFFPKAGHQVIVFSTNTEVDQKYFPELAPFISKSYLLTYDDDEECARVSPKYFWEMEKIKA